LIVQATFPELVGYQSPPFFVCPVGLLINLNENTPGLSLSAEVIEPEELQEGAVLARLSVVVLGIVAY
jgi:hypothetical protein